MPEENNNKSADMIAREDYNKIVESHNSMKVEKERLESELRSLKSKEPAEEKLRKEWESEMSGVKKQMEELVKKVEEKKDTTKVSKGLVQDRISPTNEVKTMLDEKIPDRKINPEKFGSKISRFAHYKSGMTKSYTDEQLGMGLSLHAGALKVAPDIVSSYARSRADIKLREPHSG